MGEEEGELTSMVTYLKRSDHMKLTLLKIHIIPFFIFKTVNWGWWGGPVGWLKSYTHVL